MTDRIGRYPVAGRTRQQDPVDALASPRDLPSDGGDGHEPARHRTFQRVAVDEGGIAEELSVGGTAGQVGGHPNLQIEAAAPEKLRSEEHTSELQSLMRISYAVFCLKKKTKKVQ